MECKKALQVLAEPDARQVLVSRYGIDAQVVEQMSTLFGISGICNILGAIKTAQYYEMGADDVIVTVATDALDRYYSVMGDMAEMFGTLDEAAAVGRIESIFHGMRTDWIMRGTPEARERWHNLKYYTWVEQQGKTVEELDAQRDPDWWIEHQQMVQEIDQRLVATRASEKAQA
ncbi:MAG: pyridoxal-5'-phosphate-dependent protein subunit beta, partial [Anaerolineae bacterium]|nr:pyridoxal-5'-phosphate-dependent protein subunit beta [Anaerolineae bacterium]